MSKTMARTKKDDGIVARAGRYFQETRAEIGRVSWPTREQAARLTGIVLAVTAALAAFLALVDYIFAWFIGRILAFDPIALVIALVVVVAAGVWWIVVGRRR